MSLPHTIFIGHTLSSSGDDAGYIAVAHRGGQFFALVDNTEIGSLSVSDRFTMTGVQGNATGFSPDGNYIAAATAASGGTGYLHLLNHNSGNVSQSAYLINNDSSINATKFSPDGNYLAVAINTISPGVRLYTYSNGSLTETDNYSEFGLDVDWSPDSNYLIVGGNNQIRLLENNSGTLINRASVSTGAHPSYPRGVAFSPDGNYIAVASDKGGGNPGIQLFNHTTPGTLTLSNSYTTPRDPKHVAFSKDGNYLVVGIYPDLIILDHTTPGTLSFLGTYRSSQGDIDCKGLSFTRDGNYLAVAGDANNQVELLQFDSGVLTYVSAISVSSSQAEGIAHSQHIL